MDGSMEAIKESLVCFALLVAPKKVEGDQGGWSGTVRPAVRMKDE
jgi:hypothetical protein